MNDSISRQAAIDIAEKAFIRGLLATPDLRRLPATQPEVRPIDYQDCSNAMLKMWMDNVLTDGEYNKIMDKLNDFERKRREKENG